MKKLYTKVKEYFTANMCRKIFFFGAIATLTCGIINLVVREKALEYVTIMAMFVAMVATLCDSVMARQRFSNQVKAMQAAHMQEIYEQQGAGRDVLFTPTFNDAEKKYLRRKTWQMVGAILLKLVFVITIFFLLFK